MSNHLPGKHLDEEKHYFMDQWDPFIDSGADGVWSFHIGHFEWLFNPQNLEADGFALSGNLLHQHFSCPKLPSTCTASSTWLEACEQLLATMWMENASAEDRPSAKDQWRQTLHSLADALIQKSADFYALMPRMVYNRHDWLVQRKSWKPYFYRYVSISRGVHVLFVQVLII